MKKARAVELQETYGEMRVGNSLLRERTSIMLSASTSNEKMVEYCHRKINKATKTNKKLSSVTKTIGDKILMGIEGLGVSNWSYLIGSRGTIMKVIEFYDHGNKSPMRIYIFYFNHSNIKAPTTTEVKKFKMSNISVPFRIAVRNARQQYAYLFLRQLGNNTLRIKVTWENIWLDDFRDKTFTGTETKLWRFRGQLISFVCREEKKKFKSFNSKRIKLTGVKSSAVKYDLHEQARLAFANELEIVYDTNVDFGVANVVPTAFTLNKNDSQ